MEVTLEHSLLVKLLQAAAVLIALYAFLDELEEPVPLNWAAFQFQATQAAEVYGEVLGLLQLVGFDDEQILTNANQIK